MSKDRNSQAAWIPVPSPDELPAEVGDEIGDISGQIGFVPNIARLLGVTPRHFVGWRYSDELMRGPSNLTKTQRANYRHADLEPRDRAMLDFAVKITRASEECQPSDLVRLREFGYSDEDILRIAELTAIFNYNGRLANAMGLAPNVEYHELGRRQEPDG